LTVIDPEEDRQEDGPMTPLIGVAVH